MKQPSPPATIPENDRIFLKRYLNQYYNAKRRKRALENRLNGLHRELNLAQFPAPSCLGVDSVELTIKLAEIEDRIKRQVEREAAAVLEVMEIIDFLPRESIEKEIMELRHIDCMGWRSIADHMHFSEAQCYRHYNAGFERLYEFAKVRQALKAYEARVKREEKDG